MSDMMKSENFQTKVTNRVREVFMDLIPDEELNKLIQKEIDAYFTVTDQKTTIVSGKWHQDSEIVAHLTPFRMLVWTEVNKSVMQRLKEVFEGEKFKATVQWGPDWQETVFLSSFLEKKLEEIAVKMACSMFRDMMGQAVHQAKVEVLGEMQNSMVR